MKTEVTVTIRQIPEEVFTYFNDVEKVQQWSPVTNMRLLTTGPIGLGSQFTQTVHFLGQSFESVTEVMAYDEPKDFAFKSISGPISFGQHFTLAATEEGTKLVVVADGEPGGFFKLAQPLLAPKIHKDLQDAVNKLKQLAER